ncbi:O-methyltransferase [Heyndrickxia coagulans]|uniref:O-methyltransferase n=1 Tax=Heyndrickxia coagulans TaxID=1398 RepID=UPI00047696B8|nr:O-methyltransferase [Heyndrickxia coagulans]MDT9756307.1 O-methyltransferase [Heyndrickxia coagulans]MED4312232.1 O-methyltransferase [Heyndrickxia coagulans]MED4344675.1 O-methyltransferase [Heyndrickxia coagulans]UZH06574.1 O-methyltransferase [Heyndrickxia coagulans]
MNGPVEAYIEQLMRKNDPLFEEMASFANSEHIPIMDPIGMETLCQMLRIQKPESVLEIGTAIGYSALKMADALPNVKIVTIEREEERVAQANAYFARTPLSRRIRLLKGDALCGDVIQKARELGPYDAIFIDAAKGQYRKFFDSFTPFLREKGCVYTDNVLFKGLVVQDFIEKKQVSNLVRKIRSYNEWLMQHEQFITAIFPVGDGLAVSMKR